MRARTQEAKDERRAELLAAALEVFYERGYDLARMDDIARRAGVSKGAVYLYFDGKDALFNALIQEMAAPITEQLKAAARAALDPEDAIRAVLRAAPTIIRTSPLRKILKVLISSSSSFPEAVTAYRQDVIDRALTVVASILESGRASGVFEIEDPFLTARLVVAPFVKAMIWEMLFMIDPEAEVDLEEFFTLHEKYLMRALKPAPGKTS